MEPFASGQVVDVIMVHLPAPLAKHFEQRRAAARVTARRHFPYNPVRFESTGCLGTRNERIVVCDGFLCGNRDVGAGGRQ
jgi:hypothetical protein